MVMDELIDQLDPRLGFELPSGERISIMAFADDLVLMSSSLLGIETLLHRMAGFMGERGLSINPRKSMTVGLKQVGLKTKRVRVLTKPFLSVGDSQLPVLGPLEYVRYLGVNFGVKGLGKVARKEF